MEDNLDFIDDYIDDANDICNKDDNKHQDLLYLMSISESKAKHPTFSEAPAKKRAQKVYEKLKPKNFVGSNVKTEGEKSNNNAHASGEPIKTKESNKTYTYDKTSKKIKTTMREESEGNKDNNKPFTVKVGTKEAHNYITTKNATKKKNNEVIATNNTDNRETHNSITTKDKANREHNEFIATNKTSNVKIDKFNEKDYIRVRQNENMINKVQDINPTNDNKTSKIFTTKSTQNKKNIYTKNAEKQCITGRENTMTPGQERTKQGKQYREPGKDKIKLDKGIKSKKETLNIYQINIRSIGNKKASLDKILREQDIHIAVVNELNNKIVPIFKGYHQFTRTDNRKFHGITVLVRNEFKGHAMRVPHDGDLELVHIIIKNTTPKLHILGLYLDVEARLNNEKVEAVWGQLTAITENIIKRGEATCLIGDFNRPETPTPTLEKRLLKDWTEGNDSMVEMINNPNENTRIDPHSKKGSVLDLCILSKNISKCKRTFKVDNDKKMTPFSLIKQNGTITTKSTDQLAILLKLQIPMMVAKRERKKPIINMRNPNGWENYKNKFGKIC